MADAHTLPLDSQLCFSIYSASIAIQRVYKPMLDELGVTYTQYLVLSTLWESGWSDGLGNRRQAGAGAKHDYSRGQAAGGGGFVKRRRSTPDGRQVQVYLTPERARCFTKTGCLSDTLLRSSGFTVPEMVALNRKVQSLREGMIKP